MCYRVLVVTHTCRSDQKHMLHAELCWRHCRDYAAWCAQSREWATRCTDLIFEPLLVTSTRASRLSKSECRVCSIHIPADSDSASERRMTRDYNALWTELAEGHRVINALRDQRSHAQEILRELEQIGEEHSAEYADAEDEVNLINDNIEARCNALDVTERRKNRLCEDREDKQIAKVRRAAMQDREGVADQFFFGNRTSDHLDDKEYQRDDFPEDFPKYNRRDFAADVVPFHVVQEL